MKKRILVFSVCFAIVIAGISAYMLFCRPPEPGEFSVRKEEVISYCSEQSDNGATRFLVRDLGSFHVYLSTNGKKKYTPSIFFFTDNPSHPDYYDRQTYTPSQVAQNDYAYYYTWVNLPNEEGDYVLALMAFYSGNPHHIAKAVITIDEGGELIHEEYQIDPNSDFLIVIEDLTAIGEGRVVTDWHFYNSSGAEIPEIWSATIPDGEPSE